MNVIPIDNFDEFVTHIECMRGKRDEEVEAWQQEITTGDYFVRIYDELVIYGCVEELEFEEDRQVFAMPRMKNVRQAKCYSELCVQGELGNTHVSTMALKITKAQFNAAQSVRWPSDLKVVHALLNIVPGGEA